MKNHSNGKKNNKHNKWEFLFGYAFVSFPFVKTVEKMIYLLNKKLKYTQKGILPFKSNYEEKRLQKHYAEYSEYKKTTGRFLPKIF